MISHVQTGQMDSEEVPADAQKNDTSFELNSSFKAPAEGEARLRQILDMLFDGTLIVQDGVIIETNQGLLSMTGYQPSELLGRKIEDLDGWRDVGSALAAVSEQSTSFESLLPRKYSSPVYATVRASRLFPSDPAIIIAVIAGMTENEPASASLLRSAERHRSLFQTVPDFIFTTDKDLRFVEVNPAMEKALGLPASQIVGRTAADVYGKEAGERIRAWDLRALSGETIEEEHAVLVRGEKLIFHDIRVPLRNSAGQIMGVCGICRDITERRAIEEKSALVPAGYRSKATGRTMELARQAATTDSIVLLLGESGSGRTIWPDGYTIIQVVRAVHSLLSTVPRFRRIWQNQS
jgi:PAS domain S-box-containing protein